jgi:preprotein translocase subunit YajC
MTTFVNSPGGGVRKSFSLPSLLLRSNDSWKNTGLTAKKKRLIVNNQIGKDFGETLKGFGVIEVANHKIISFIFVITLIVGSPLLSSCTPVSTGESSGDFNWIAVIMAMVLLAIVYFLIIRPMRKRQKDQQILLAELKVGDHVIAAGGIYGEIESIDVESLVINVESGAKIRVTKQGLLVKRSPKK